MSTEVLGKSERGTLAYLLGTFDKETLQRVQYSAELGESVRFISGDIRQLSDIFEHPRESGVNDPAYCDQMATVWKDTLVKAVGQLDLDREDRLTNLPNLPHSLHFLDYSIHRFLTSVKSILVISIHETLRGVQNFIDLVHLSLLMSVTEF